MMNKSVQLAIALAHSVGMQVNNTAQAVKQFFVPRPGSVGSMNTGSTKLPKGHIGKRGKTWSFISANHDGTGQFRCRQNGEIQTFVLKVKDSLNKHEREHFFGEEAAA